MTQEYRITFLPQLHCHRPEVERAQGRSIYPIPSQAHHIIRLCDITEQQPMLNDKFSETLMDNTKQIFPLF